MSTDAISIEGRVTRLETQIAEDRRLIFGHWVDDEETGAKKRIPGILEQMETMNQNIANTLNEIKARDDKAEAFVEIAKKVAWRVVTPILAIIGTAAFAGVVKWLATLSLVPPVHAP